MRFPEDKRELGRMLREKRKSMGITLAELSKTLNIHFTTLSRLEKGHWGDQYEVLLKVGAFLNLESGEHVDYISQLEFGDLIKEYMQGRGEIADPVSQEDCLRALEAVYLAFTKSRRSGGGKK